MTSETTRHDAETERLAMAKAGDERAFEALTQPLRRELRVHCYRMLGTLADADDALQETLLRAWRQLDRFEPRAPFRAWLYRIATNVCLTMLARRGRRGEVALLTAESYRDATSRQEGEPVLLQPYPDHLLDELAPEALGPEVTVEHRESVELAFVAAVQWLPPRQRATLLLRDVLGYTTAEVAPMLETTIGGVNSALQRARERLTQERAASHVTHPHASPGTVAEQALVRHLIEAWHAADVTSIVAVLTQDALLTMPPLPDRYVGRQAIGAFLATVPAGGRLDRFRLVPMRANRQPAVAAFLRDGDEGAFQAHAIVVLAFSNEGITSLTRFADLDLFSRFGLPDQIDGSAI